VHGHQLLLHGTARQALMSAKADAVVKAMRKRASIMTGKCPCCRRDGMALRGWPLDNPTFYLCHDCEAGYLIP
jgi:hypothetical protein